MISLLSFQVVFSKRFFVFLLSTFHPSMLLHKSKDISYQDTQMQLVFYVHVFYCGLITYN